MDQTGELEASWSLRLNDRSVMNYDVQLISMRKRAKA